MSIIQKKIEKLRGDCCNWKLTFTDASKLPINITGWTIFFTLKLNIDDVDDDAIIAKDIINHTNPSTGETQILLESSETNDLLGNYLFDIQYKKSAETNVYTILSGSIVFKKDITRRNNNG